MATRLSPSLSLARFTVLGITTASVSESRKMKLPIWVTPVAVLETPSTGTPACWAMGSAARATSERVGPDDGQHLVLVDELLEDVRPGGLVPRVVLVEHLQLEAGDGSAVDLLRRQLHGVPLGLPVDGGRPVRAKAVPILAPLSPPAVVPPPPLPLWPQAASRLPPNAAPARPAVHRSIPRRVLVLHLRTPCSVPRGVPKDSLEDLSRLNVNRRHDGPGSGAQSPTAGRFGDPTGVSRPRPRDQPPSGVRISTRPLTVRPARRPPART